MTWLTKLGPSGLAALVVGLLLLLLVGAVGRTVSLLMMGKLVPRDTLEREQKISDQWRQAHDTLAAAVEPLTAAVERHTEAVRQLVATHDRRSWDDTGTGRHRHGG